jgi:lysophospholipase L1-like esterase
MASIRWAGAYAPLRTWDYVYDAESCRRTLLPSCAQPDGWAPETGLTVMDRLSGRLGQVLVIMLGANDAPSRFGEGVDDVVAKAKAQGISAVIWLTIPTMASQNATLAQRVGQDGGYLRLADWAGYVVGHPEWLNSDGLHVSTAGAPVLSQFIADQVTAALAG